MQENQSVQQSSESNAATPSNQGDLDLPKSKSALTEIKQRPWLLWGGMLTLVVAIAGFAAASLTHTGEVERPEPIQTTVLAPTEPEQTTVLAPIVRETPPATDSPPGWLWFVVLVASGAAGVVIFKLVNRPVRRSHKLKKRVKRSATVMRSPRKQQRSPRKKRPKARRNGVNVPVPLTPAATVQAQIEPMVTVLPPEETHPLDRGQESLADMMDLRKQRPLSSILQDRAS